MLRELLAKPVRLPNVGVKLRSASGQSGVSQLLTTGTAQYAGRQSLLTKTLLFARIPNALRRVESENLLGRGLQ